MTGYDVHYTSAPSTGTGSVADDAAVQTGQSPSAADGWVDAGHSATAASQSITGLTADKAYRVRVRAKNAAGVSRWLTGTHVLRDAYAGSPGNVLVSNVDLPDTTSYAPEVYGLAQCFTTGSTAGGYSVGSVELDLSRAGTVPPGQRKQIDVELWSAATDGNPSQLFRQLITPSSLSAGNVEFAAPAATTLTASTTYCVVFNKTEFDLFGWAGTSSADEDAGGAAGWSIADGSRLQSAGRWGAFPNVLQIRVNAQALTTPSPPTRLTLSTDAANDTAAEGSGSVTVTATLDNPAGSDGVAVTLSAGAASTAEATDDYTLPNAFTIESGEIAATADVSIVDDDLVEDSESLALTATAGSLTVAGVTLTVTDDDAAAAKVAFGSDAAGTAKHAVSVAENVSGGKVDVPVTVSHLPAASTTFAVEVLNTGTATEYTDAQNPGDFRIETKSVTFGPTDTDKTRNVAVTITDDAVLEPDETIELRIAAADNPATALEDHYARDENGALATVTITNDEPPDETPPSPEFNPAAGQAVSDTGTNITLTFDEAVKKDSTGSDFSGHADLSNVLTLAVGDESGTAIPFAATIDAAGKVITLDPTNALAEGKVYVAISDVYYDAAGNQGTAGSATFTVDTTPPAAPEFSPVNGHKEQNPGTNITLTFAEALRKDATGTALEDADLASILTLAVDDENGTAIGFAATIDDAKKVITLDPSSDLDAGTVYVAISADHWDAAGNQGAAASATFTVRPVKPTDLTVTAGDTKLDLSWTAPAGTVTGYDVHYTSAVAGTVADNASVQTGQSPSAADGWVDAGHSGTAASQSLTGLTADKTYRLRVRAKNAAGVSGWLTGTHVLREAYAGSPGNVLVSNVRQSDTVQYSMRTQTRAQCFTTGSTAGGYGMGSVELDLARVRTLNTVQRRQIDVELWSTTTDGSPSQQFRQLTTPSSVSAGNMEFAAPAGTTLAASTTYCVVLKSTSLDGIDWAGAGSGSEDTGGAAGWSIADRHRVLRGPQFWREEGNALQIRVNVMEQGDTTPPSPAFSPPNGRVMNNPGRNIRLTFAEAITRNSSGDAIADADLSSILTLKVDDENGAAIGFSASINSPRR